MKDITLKVIVRVSHVSVQGTSKFLILKRNKFRRNCNKSSSSTSKKCLKNCFVHKNEKEKH